MVESSADRLAWGVAIGCLIIVIGGVGLVAKLHADLLALNEVAEVEIVNFRTEHDLIWKEALKLADKFGRRIEKRQVHKGRRHLVDSAEIPQRKRHLYAYPQAVQIQNPPFFSQFQQVPQQVTRPVAVSRKC
ncbi:hypothetical protein COOONC_17667 [Cooperia oncophora]